MSEEARAPGREAAGDAGTGGGQGRRGGGFVEADRPAVRRMDESIVHMTEIVMPNDTNPHGSVSGGRVLHLVDIAAAVSAMRHARRKVVTAAIDEVVFHAPVPLGHVLLLTAQVTCVGRTSMEVKVEVEGENPLTGERRHTTTAHVVFVALDDEGRPAEVPALETTSDEERALVERALERRERRLARHRKAE